MAVLIDAATGIEELLFQGISNKIMEMCCLWL